MTMYSYQPQGVCSKIINLELDGDKIKHVEFVGGCPGNLTAISKLVEGKPIEEIASLLEGTRCGRKPTSCSDQMVKAIRAVQEFEAKQPEEQAAAARQA